MLLLELCCEQDSELAEQVPAGAIAVRVTSQEDLTSKATVRSPVDSTCSRPLQLRSRMGIGCVHSWVQTQVYQRCSRRSARRSSPHRAAYCRYHLDLPTCSPDWANFQLGVALDQSALEGRTRHSLDVAS